MTQSPEVLGARIAPRSGLRRFPTHVFGLVPFLVFPILFLVLPTIDLLVGSVHTKTGAFTLDNFAHLTRPFTDAAYGAGVEISLVTAGAARVLERPHATPAAAA